VHQGRRLAAGAAGVRAGSQQEGPIETPTETPTETPGAFYLQAAAGSEDGTGPAALTTVTYDFKDPIETPIEC
jgi:hypothetical protein